MPCVFSGHALVIGEGSGVRVRVLVESGGVGTWDMLVYVLVGGWWVKVPDSM